MPDYNKLRDLLSHRVRIEYDTGASVTGYLARCLPGDGPVQLLHLARVEILGNSGAVLERRDEMSLCPNALIGVTLDEGPRGRDLD